MLCEFASTFPEFVGDLLEREAGLGRRFREETLTDMWVGSLVPLRRYGVHVDLANEKETGADIELWFLSRRLDRGLGFVIQAKRAVCPREPTHPFCCSHRDWTKHRFEEIDHPGGRSKATGNERMAGSQARDLVQAAKRTKRALYPLYAFYTPEHVRRQSGNAVDGVMLADGFEVRRRIVQGLWRTRKREGARRRGRAAFKEIAALRDLLLKLDKMFCIDPGRPLKDVFDRDAARLVLLDLTSSGIRFLNIPDPDDVARSMRSAITAAREGGRDLPLPQVTHGVPNDILGLASGERTRFSGAIEGTPPPRARIALVATSDRAAGEER